MSSSPDLLPTDSQVSYIRGLVKNLSHEPDDLLQAVSTRRQASVLIDRLVVLQKERSKPAPSSRRQARVCLMVHAQGQKNFEECEELKGNQDETV